METTTLKAEVRTQCGKGPARRLRASGKIPAVFYGPGQSPTPLTVDPAELAKHLHGTYGRNTLFELAYGDNKELAMVKDLTVTPVSRDLLHVDFYKVSLDREVRADVPLRTTGRAIGVVKGGVLNVTRRTIPVVCTPDRIPAEIVIDVTDVDMHGTVDVKDLPLPEGVRATLRPELTLAIVLEDKRAAKAAEEAEKAEAAAEA
ncbi:MAG: 50S ribosomal protein L25 [Myxococcota bacterium]